MPAISLGNDSARISRRRPAFLLHGGGKILALGSRDLFQCVHWHVDFAREGLGGRSWRAIFVSDFEGGTGDLLANIGLRGRDTSGEHSKAARGGERVDVRILGQPLALQKIAHAARQLLARAVDHARGDFFGADLEKEVRHKRSN